MKELTIEELDRKYYIVNSKGKKVMRGYFSTYEEAEEMVKDWQERGIAVTLTV